MFKSRNCIHEKFEKYLPVDPNGVPLVNGVLRGAVGVGGDSDASCGEAVKLKLLGSDTWESTWAARGYSGTGLLITSLE